MSRDILARKLADPRSVVGAVEVLDETVQLARYFLGLIVRLVKFGICEIALISGDVQLAADFAGGGFGLAQVLNKLAPRSAFRALRALTAGKKCSWGAMLDMTLTAARWIWSRRPKSWENAPASVCS